MSKDRSLSSLDDYTKHVLQAGISRRTFMQRSVAGAAGIGTLGMGLGGSSPVSAATSNADEFGKSSDGSATLAFLRKPAAIADADIKETLTFDVVVVGAGASGVTAALSAAEAGASVGVIQKHPLPVAQGNTGSGIDLAKSEQAGIEALVAKLCVDNNHRCNPELVRQWAYNSGEAVRWVIDRTLKGGGQVVDQGSGPQGAIRKINGYELNYVTSFMGPKPYTTGDGIRALAKTAEKAGVQFFFRTPGVQLIQNGAGNVLGVIAKGKAMGVVRDAVDPDALFDIAVGALMFRLLVSTEAPGETLVDAISDIVLAGVARG